MRMIGIFLFGWAAHVIIFTVTNMILISTVKPAYALSCMPAVLDKAAIESHQVIFEGTVTSVKSAGFGHAVKGSKLKKYEFHIDAHWYGDGYQTGQSVTVFALPGWASDYAYKKDQKAMVFARYNKDLSGKAEALTASPGWCGFDILGTEQNRKVLQDYKNKINK